MYLYDGYINVVEPANKTDIDVLLNLHMRHIYIYTCAVERAYKTYICAVEHTYEINIDVLLNLPIRLI